MTRKEPLTALLETVETGAEHQLVKAIEGVFGGFGPPDEGTAWAAFNAYHHSLDAAMALHEAGVPEWVLNSMSEGIDDEFRPTGEWEVGLCKPQVDCLFEYATGEAGNPARAWLIAIIKALISGDAE